MDIQGRPSVPGGIGEADFYVPRDAMIERFGVAALAAVLGDEGEASKLSWTRRLVRRRTDDEWLIVIAECPFISTGEVGHALPWTVAGATNEIKIAYPLAEGVRILASPENPELELQRRRDLIERQAARERAEDAEARRKLKAEEDREAKRKKDAAEFRETAWLELTTLERFAYSLAVAVKPHDPKLAAVIRSVAQESQRCGPVTNGRRGFPLDCPHCEWWT